MESEWGVAIVTFDFISLSPVQQYEQKSEIIQWFREFWATSPTEEEFAKATLGMVVFPEIFYILARGVWR